MFKLRLNSERLFQQINDQEKTIDARIRYPSYTKIQVGNVLEFRWFHREVYRRVSAIYVYDGFEDMLKTHGVRACAPHLEEGDLEGALNFYHSFPDYKRLAKSCGVIAFRLGDIQVSPAVPWNRLLPSSRRAQAMLAAVRKAEDKMCDLTTKEPTSTNTPTLVSPITTRRTSTNTTTKSSTPSTTTSAGVTSTVTSDSNILVIGIITHPDGVELTTDTSKRDQSRVIALRHEFKTVFTMSYDDGSYDLRYHLTHKMDRNGAKALIAHLNLNYPSLKIDFICLEYVRMAGTYYQNFVTGGPTTPVPGCALRDFVVTLRRSNKLNPRCKLLVARIEITDRWSKTIANLKKVFGNVHYVKPMDNPLFRAGEKTQVDNNKNLKRPYDHRVELDLRCRDPKPFAEFTVGLLPSPTNALDPESTIITTEPASTTTIDLTKPTPPVTPATNDKNNDNMSSSDLSDGDDGDRDSDSDFVCDSADEDNDTTTPTTISATTTILPKPTLTTPATPATNISNGNNNNDNIISSDVSNRDDGERDSGLDFVCDLLNDNNNNDATTITAEPAFTTPTIDNNNGINNTLATPIITTPTLSTPENIVTPELIRKAAMRIHAGNGYKQVCVEMGINLDSAGKYIGSKGGDYKRIQTAVRKLKRSTKYLQSDELKFTVIRLTGALETADRHAVETRERENESVKQKQQLTKTLEDLRSRYQDMHNKYPALLKERDSALQQLAQLNQRAVTAEQRVLAGMCVCLCLL